MDNETLLAKIYHECKKSAEASINTCFYPGCSLKSINSHILQKNGILSKLEVDSHVFQLEINKFRKNNFYFKRIGINNAYSFNCFCSNHDSSLFERIETREIDFNLYKNRILFTLRTVLNEKFRKIVMSKVWDSYIKDHSDVLDPIYYKELKVQGDIGISDLEKIESVIWSDILSETESYIFLVREISEKEICLSSFYTYETTQELTNYRDKHGKNKENLCDIFVNLFPYKGKSIFMMGYKKTDEPIVKSYVNSFFTESEKRLERKLTNLILFLCETWVVSETFYLKRIKNCESIFEDAIHFSVNNPHERRFFDINLFQGEFCTKFQEWKKKYFILS